MNRCKQGIVWEVLACYVAHSCPASGLVSVHTGSSALKVELEWDKLAQDRLAQEQLVATRTT